RNPAFSPDGVLVAFTGEYDGNPDVYVVPAAGGTPRRLTFHPGDDVVVGWTPDGKSVLFRSSRLAHAAGVSQLFTVALTAGSEPRRRPFLPTADASPTCRSSSGRRRGSGIAGGRPGPSGSRPSPTRPCWPRSRARTRTTSTPCGSATPSTSSPTARVPRRCSP